MKAIIELRQKIKDRGVFLNQFQRSGTIKNVLYVNPSLSGKSLYRTILPHLTTNCEEVATAITGIEEFGLEESLLSYKILDSFDSESANPDKDMMIAWANVISFPMTLQPLIGIYEYIRSINPRCHIIYNLDFDVWNMEPSHPLFEMFSDEFITGIVEDNCWYANTIGIAGIGASFFEPSEIKSPFADFIESKMQELSVSKYSTPVNVVVIPKPLFDCKQITMGNVEPIDEVSVFKIPVKIPETPIPEVKPIKKRAVKPKAIIKKIEPKKRTKKK